MELRVTLTIFIHRMLLDYFADLTPQSAKDGDGKTARRDLA
jgi:hypothetical protein